MNISITLGDKKWIAGIENFAYLLSNIMPYFDEKSILILSRALKRKRYAKYTKDSTILAMSDEIENVDKINDYYNLGKLPVGSLYLEGETIPVYQYNDIFMPLQVNSLFSFYHNCFIDKSISNYIQNKNIIDIGAGPGCSSAIFSKYTSEKVFAIDASPYMSMMIDHTIRLNGINNIINKHLVIYNRNKTIFFTNQKNTLNYICSENNKLPKISNISYSIDELFKIDQQLLDLNNIGLIKIHTPNSNFEVLQGAENTITKYKPILIISLTDSGLSLFHIINYIIDKFSFYQNMKIVKTHELHAMNGLFLICNNK